MKFWEAGLQSVLSFTTSLAGREQSAVPALLKTLQRTQSSFGSAGREHHFLSLALSAPLHLLSAVLGLSDSCVVCLVTHKVEFEHLKVGRCIYSMINLVTGLDTGCKTRHIDVHLGSTSATGIGDRVARIRVAPLRVVPDL
jgi:hypothetical protein